MNERQNYTQYEIGDRVLVSDGKKRPPDRFNRKLADWKHNNYTGWVYDIEPESEYSPYGRLVMKRDDYPDGLGGAISFQFNIPLGGYLRVDKIKEVKAA
jgi:hypothetical protein